MHGALKMRIFSSFLSYDTAYDFLMKFPERLLAIAFVLCAASTFIGCAGPAAVASGPPPTQVKITTQPTNQAVPIDRAATFAVVATGTAPISYQWSKNGANIAGATSASYTTSNITSGDSGSTYQVTVSNAANSVSSNTVTLTAGPRAPAIGDLRYLLWEQVTVPGLGQPNSAGQPTIAGTNIVDGMWSSYSNAVGTPLEVGNSESCYTAVDYDCSWLYEVNELPSGMTTWLGMLYTSGAYSQVSADLQSAVAPNRVILSLDLEPANKSYAFAYVQTSQTGGFDYRMESVPPSDVAATVAADGANSRVVTAVSIDNTTGLVDIISYGWQGDTTTAYDTQTTLVQPQDAGSAASTLANNGYAISAFGGNDTSGYVLIGMRVHGDSMPRAVSVNVGHNWTPPSNPDSAYYTTVVYLTESGGGTIVTEQ
jgi:hypothetical protein